MDIEIVNTWHDKLDGLWELRGYKKLNEETIKGLYEFLMLSTVFNIDNLNISLLHTSNEEKKEIIKSYVMKKYRELNNSYPFVINSRTAFA